MTNYFDKPKDKLLQEILKITNLDEASRFGNVAKVPAHNSAIDRAERAIKQAMSPEAKAKRYARNDAKRNADSGYQKWKETHKENAEPVSEGDAFHSVLVKHGYRKVKSTGVSMHGPSSNRTHVYAHPSYKESKVYVGDGKAQHVSNEGGGTSKKLNPKQLHKYLNDYHDHGIKEEVEQVVDEAKKSALQRLRDFDKSRVAAGKSPIFKNNPIAQNMNKFNKPSVVKDKKKEEKKGYVKHSNSLNSENVREAYKEKRYDMRIHKDGKSRSTGDFDDLTIAKQVHRGNSRFNDKGEKLKIHDRQQGDKVVHEAIIDVDILKVRHMRQKDQLRRRHQREKEANTTQRSTIARLNTLRRNTSEGKIVESLEKKAARSGIPLSVLEIVFNRGLNEQTNKDKYNTAFDRVNSFIAGGRARDIDSDLED